MRNKLVLIFCLLTILFVFLGGAAGAQGPTPTPAPPSSQHNDDPLQKIADFIDFVTHNPVDKLNQWARERLHSVFDSYMRFTFPDFEEPTPWNNLRWLLSGFTVVAILFGMLAYFWRIWKDSQDKPDIVYIVIHGISLILMALFVTANPEILTNYSALGRNIIWETAKFLTQYLTLDDPFVFLISAPVTVVEQAFTQTGGPVFALTLLAGAFALQVMQIWLFLSMIIQSFVFLGTLSISVLTQKWPTLFLRSLTAFFGAGLNTVLMWTGWAVTLTIAFSHEYRDNALGILAVGVWMAVVGSFFLVTALTSFIRMKIGVLDRKKLDKESENEEFLQPI